MNKICYGCGAKLQSNNNNQDGYIPKEKIKDSEYCQRCFKIMHYGFQSKSSTPKETDVIINSINNDDKFVIFLADFLSLNSQVVEIFKKIKSKKVLVISKIDIILKSIKEVHIRSFLKEYYQIDTDIRLISSTNNFGVESLTNYLYQRRIDNAYLVGLSNSGKSTLINKLLESNNSNMKQITTSYIPNTTLDFIRIKINDNLTLIDSPGFIIDTVNDDNFIKKNNIKVFLKPKTFQMKANETLEIENMYLNFSSDTSITIYMSNNLKVKKYFKPLDFDYEVNVANNEDLIISGLGFINIKKSCTIKILNIKEKFVETRKSVFGEINE